MVNTERTLLFSRDNNRLIVNLRLLLIYMSIVLLFGNYLLYSFFKIDTLKTILRVMSVFLLVLSLLLKNKFTFFECILLLISLYLIVINGSVSLNIAICLLLIVCIDDVGSFYKVFHELSLAAVIIVFLSLLTGIVESYQYERLNGDIVRNTFGFFNVNSSSLFFLSYFICYLISKSRKFFNFVYVVLFSVAIYLFTDSRTSFFSLIVLLLFYCFLSCCKFKLVKKTVAFIIVLLLFFSPLLWLFQFMNAYDVILSFRVSIFRDYIKANSIFTLLFGGTKILDIDNFYLLLLFNSGIIIYSLIFFGVIKTSNKFINQDKNIEVSVLFAVLFAGLFESLGVRLELPVVMLFWLLIGESFKELSYKQYSRQHRGLDVGMII